MMPRTMPFSQSRIKVIALVAAVTSMTACAKSLTGTMAPLQQRAYTAPAVIPNVEHPAVAADSTPPVVLLRYYAHSPTVTVVAWEPGRSAYGLRTTIRRDGTLVFDHQLYVSTYHFVELAAFARADWNFVAPQMENPQRLLSTGFHRDVHSCEEDDGDIGCSPFITLRARIPDALLRNSTGDVAVRIVGQRYNEVTLFLRRAMIDAYLQKVDAVTTAIVAN